MSRFTLLDPKCGSQVPAGTCALGIMTKAPRAGQVKTRLTPPLTAEEAAELNRCFLRDLSRSIELAGDMAPSRGVAIYTPIGAEKVYDDILPDGFFLIPQRGDAFGERLLFAAEDLFRVGFTAVCLINSDSPTVPAAAFAQAALELADPRDRVVLGPSDDGGYYLIGLKKTHRVLFERIDWSTERVLEQTKARARELNLPVVELESGLDIDDEQSLRRLQAELGPDSRLNVAPCTRKMLETLDL